MREYLAETIVWGKKHPRSAVAAAAFWLVVPGVSNFPLYLAGCRALPVCERHVLAGRSASALSLTVERLPMPEMPRDVPGQQRVAMVARERDVGVDSLPSLM
ncbi:MAG: hypothetical protein H6922_01885 [Pseudomonadaceae bacterium]|nr:hypothetical protein [Pseudomonadaceae bacterium]